MKKFPQRVINVPHNGNKADLDQVAIAKTAQHAEAKLGKKRRVLVRYSGTESAIRIMVEGEDGKLVDTLAQELEHTLSDPLIE